MVIATISASAFAQIGVQVGGTFALVQGSQIFFREIRTFLKKNKISTAKIRTFLKHTNFRFRHQQNTKNLHTYNHFQRIY